MAAVLVMRLEIVVPRMVVEQLGLPEPSLGFQPVLFRTTHDPNVTSSLGDDMRQTRNTRSRWSHITLRSDPVPFGRALDFMSFAMARIRPGAMPDHIPTNFSQSANLFRVQWKHAIPPRDCVCLSYNINPCQTSLFLIELIDLKRGRKNTGLN